MPVGSYESSVWDGGGILLMYVCVYVFDNTFQELLINLNFFLVLQMC